MSKLTAAQMQAKAAQVAHTLTVEKWEALPDTREIKLKGLKQWGFDLIAGRKAGESTWFLADADRHQAGDRYTQDDITFEVEEVLSKLPANTRLTVALTSEDHEARLEILLEDNDGAVTSLLKLPAAEILLAMAKKHQLGQLLAQLHSVGLTTEVMKKHGEQGRSIPFEELPPAMRRVVREARDILRKHAAAGRFELSYFGENKDGKARYQASFLLPTLDLLDLQTANQVDKLLAELNP